MSEATDVLIRVYYVRGTGPEGAVTDLGKYFRAEDAERHLARIPRASLQVAYTNLRVAEEHEPASEQHEVHAGVQFERVVDG